MLGTGIEIRDMKRNRIGRGWWMRFGSRMVGNEWWRMKRKKGFGEENGDGVMRMLGIERIDDGDVIEGVSINIGDV
ncbi:hypothetical protein [Bacillus altitudinis]|uniref:hypothetical protein n=1 Tax=Bacillus altitudinis TaxID=293387 RepID=UPI0011A4FF4B|nr:hypothetical protein [Bacillus altitudinis]